MPELRSCPRGHRWHSFDDRKRTTSVAEPCPVCGETAVDLNIDQTLDVEPSPRRPPAPDATLAPDEVVCVARASEDATLAPDEVVAVKRARDDATIGLDGKPVPPRDRGDATMDLAPTEKADPGATGDFASPAAPRNTGFVLSEKTSSTPLPTLGEKAARPADDGSTGAWLGPGPGGTDATELVPGMGSRRPQLSDATQDFSDTERPERYPRDTDAATQAGVSTGGSGGRGDGLAVEGYEILGELGRGGMGVVYKARQKGLNRIVALKMVLSGAHASDQDLARFRIEAEAVARLQHPNIVAVYDVGEVEGRPYFSLEFVEGKSLASKIAGVPQEPREAARLMQALADAMYFAHRQGIIHRDLKPANILMTLDGVPKITDFGLAKHIDEEDAGQTRSGAILGTPSYMAPEQAEGKTKECGPPADIYSLGAVFYDLLTGRPPFRGATILDTLNQVRSAEPVPVSRLLPNTPKDLETICLKCLEKEPARRYTTAGELAGDLQRYLAGEPIKARPTPWYERTYKWCRRYPWVAAVIALIALGVFSATATGFWIANSQYKARLEADRLTEEAQKQERVAQNNERLAKEAEKIAREQRDAAEQARKLAQERKEQAERERERAEQNLVYANLAVDRMLTRIADKRLANEPRFEQVRRDALKEALALYQRMSAQKGSSQSLQDDTARAHLRVGNIQEMLGDKKAAEAAYGQAAGLFRELIGRSLDRFEYRQGLATAYTDLALLLLASGRRDEANKTYLLAIETKEWLVAHDPKSPAYRQELGKSYNNRGLHLQTGNDLAGAEAAYTRAIRLFEELAAEQPNEPDHRRELAKALGNLGAVQQQTGRPAAAEKAYQRAIDHLTQLVAQDKLVSDRNELGRAYWNTGVVHHMNRKFPAAEQNYQKAIDIFVKLMDQYPAVPEYRHELASTYGNFASLLQAQNRLGESAEVRRSSITLLTHLVEEVRTEVNYRLDLARALNELGMFQATIKKFADAESSWQQAITQLQALVAQFPAEAVFQYELALATGNLGILMMSQGRHDRAEEGFRLAVEQLTKLEKKDPNVPAYRQNLILFQTNLAKLLALTARWQDASRDWQDIVALHAKTAKAAPRSAAAQLNWAQALVDWATLLLEHERLPDAILRVREATQHFKTATELAPKAPAARNGLCSGYALLMDALLRSEDSAAAAEVGKELVAAAAPDWPDAARAGRLFARCVAVAEKDKQLNETTRHRLRQQCGDEAVKFLRRAFERDPALVGRLRENPDLDPLRGRDDFRQLVGETAAQSPKSGS